jgi:hypothetical protein
LQKREKSQSSEWEEVIKDPWRRENKQACDTLKIISQQRKEKQDKWPV